MEKPEHRNNQNQSEHNRRPGDNSLPKLIHPVSTLP
jgi:hypothetical protein